MYMGRGGGVERVGGWNFKMLDNIVHYPCFSDLDDFSCGRLV